MSPICRLCLNSSATRYEEISSIDHEQLELVLPEIDVNLVQLAVVCSSCVELIKTTYSFKSNCIETEKLLKFYIEQVGEGSLCLEEASKNYLKRQPENVDVKPILVHGKIKLENDGWEENKDNSGVIKCGICKKNFSFEDFEQHKAGHCAKPKCEICGKLFSDVYNLKKHINTHESGDGEESNKDELYIFSGQVKTNSRKVKCKTCDKLCKNTLSLERHILSEHQIDVQEDKAIDVETKNDADLEMEDKVSKSYKCEMCETSYTTNRYLLAHVKTHFERPKCKICDKAYYNLQCLKRHISTVHNIVVNPGTSDQIDNSWRDEINFEVDEDKMEETLKRHIELYQGGDEIEINPELTERDESSGLEGFNDEDDYFGDKDSQEMFIVRPYKCEMCNKSYNIKSNLLDHLKTHFKRPKCKLCNKFYYNIHCLKRHMMQIHNIEISTKPNEVDDNVKVEVFVDNDETSNEQDKNSKNSCEICGKSFTTKSSFHRHKLIHTNDKCFVCDFCQKGFLTKTYLERHINTCHLGRPRKKKLDRIFTCDTCGLTTNNKHSLIQHIRIHTGERPYKCEECGKAFAQSSSLGTHKRTVHSTERLFTCEYCSKSFNAKGSLTKHILEVHMVDKIEKKFICNYCGKKYRLQSQLNSHLKWHNSDRQYCCDICGKPFVDRHSVKKHRVTHFPEKKHKCEICGKGFHQKYNIKIHMKVHSRVPE